MKKGTIALVIIACVLMISTAYAQERSTLLKANAVYQFATFEGYRTHSAGWGATIEKHIGYSKKSVIFVFDYLYRTDDLGYLSYFDDMYYFAIGGKQYASYEMPMHGPYVGVLFGLGIPSEQGVFWDLDFLLGYQLVKDKIAVDFCTAIGFGSFNFREDFPAGSIYYYYPGFVFRPSLSVGFAF